MGKTDFFELREMRSFPSFFILMPHCEGTVSKYTFLSNAPYCGASHTSLLAVAVGAWGDAFVLLEGAGKGLGIEVAGTYCCIIDGSTGFKQLFCLVYAKFLDVLQKSDSDHTLKGS